MILNLLIIIYITSNQIMIRNSTQKFKEKYDKSLTKRSGSMRSLNSKNYNNFQSLTSSTLKTINSFSKSTAKIQTPKLNNFKTLISQVNLSNGKSKIQIFNQKTENTFDYLMKKKCIKQKMIFPKQKAKPNRIFSAIKLNRQPQQFIDNLKKNELFFCCQCYQYIYEIQKKRHYPDCKDRILFVQNSNSEEKKNIAHQRLQRILKLAQYTSNNSQEIQDLYKAYQNGNYIKLQAARYPRGVMFYTFEEINYAFLFIYNKFAKYVHNEGNSGYLMKCGYV